MRCKRGPDLKYQRVVGALRQDACFCHEHPGSASSWDKTTVKVVACTPGVVCVKFHQCMYGLVSKMDCAPVLKLTQFVTNILEMACEFKDVRRKGHHLIHRTIQGAEGGEKRSTHAQRYPPALCEAIVRCIAHCLTRGS